MEKSPWVWLTVPKYLDGSEEMIKICLSMGGGRNGERRICQVVRGLCEHEPGGHAQADRKAMEEKQLSKVALYRLGM